MVFFRISILAGKPQQNEFMDNEIPNRKHQITNKSQITISNDQNLRHRWVTWVHNHALPVLNLLMVSVTD